VGHEHVVECIQWVPEKLTNQLLASDQPKEKEGSKTNIKIHNLFQILAKLNADIEQKNAVLISASRDRSIKFWDVFSGTCLFSLIGHDNWVRDIRLHPNGKYLVSVSDDKTLRIWSIEHRRCTKMLSAHEQFITSIGLVD
jgi:platelet-activating factor acetylhydrolase IB subunit alpha